MSKDIESSCDDSRFEAIFGITSTFLVALGACILILLILMLAVFIRIRKDNNLREKLNDPMGIIGKENKEGDYDLEVLQPLFVEGKSILLFMIH